MKLALVIEKFDPHGGGAERSTAQIVTELARRGHDVTIIAGSCRNPDAIADVQVCTPPGWNPRSMSGLLAFSRWARQQLREGGFDASLSMTTAVPATILQPRSGTVRETLARNVAMRRSLPGRAIKRLLILLTPKYRAQLILERRTLKDPGVRRILAVSRYVIDQLQVHYHVDPEKVELLANAATVPTVDQGQRRQWRRRVRQGLGIGEEAVVYVFIAKNPRLKGYGPLLEAIRIMAQAERADFAVLLVGDFTYRHHDQAVKLGVRDRVKFLGTTEHAAAAYAAADVTVLPSFYDPASKVVIESLMLGVPAITSAYNGASDLIEPTEREGVQGGDSRRGRVIADPADNRALADAMIELADPAQRQQCRKACAGLAGELSMVRHVDRLEQVMAGVVGHSLHEDAVPAGSAA